MNFRFGLLSICLIWSSSAYAQKTDLMNFVPVSANAASLGKFGNVPVSYYTGVPSIEIPLYVLEQNSLKVPIKLSYHAGGIKVSELASWVGLGWALNAGGSIIRSERGLGDDMGTVGYLTNGKTIDGSSLNITDYYNAAKGWVDLESDEYLLNFPGGAGKFVLDKEANALLIPHQPMKIYPLAPNGQVYTPSSMSYIAGWKIIVTDGTQYFFEAREMTEQPLEFANNIHVAGWNLTKAISSNKEDTIVFEYEEASYSARIPMSQTKKEFIQSGSGSNYCGAETSFPVVPVKNVMQLFTQKRLRKILFRNGRVEIFPSAYDRCDLPGEEWLDRIKVFDTSNNLIKEVKFKYGYMIGAAITPLEQVSCNSEINGRLMLLSVQENGKTPYTFDYIHDKGLPSRYSAAQDHWGFFNRPDNGSVTLIPSRTVLTNGQVILGAEREANVDFGKQGTLNRVTYPTGGTTQFEYEGHRAVLYSLSNFPEYAASYNVETNLERVIQVDYIYNNQEVANFTVNYVESGTSVYFKTENFVEASGSYFKVVDAAGVDMQCVFWRQEGAVRHYSCVNLPNGTYRIIAMNRFSEGEEGPSGQTYPLTILEYDNVTSVPGNTLTTIGGLRIHKIIDTDPLTGNVQSKEFEYSNGSLVWGFKYGSKRKEYLCYTLQGDVLGGYTQAFYEYLSSSSNYPLSNTQGAPVGYGNAIMREYYYKGDGTKVENGYTAFAYTSPLTYPDNGFISYYISGLARQEPPSQGSSFLYEDGTQATFKFPYAPPRNNDWKRGLLLDKAVYRKNNDGAYSIVSAELNYYSFASLPRSVQSVKCGLIFDASIPTGSGSEMRPVNPPLDEVVFSYYNAVGEYMYLAKTEASMYSGNGVVRTETEYFYDNQDHQLPTRTIKTLSSGEKVVTVTAYPQDYVPGTGFINAMVAENNISTPIENVTYQEGPAGAKVTLGSLYQYSNDNKGLLENIKVLESADGIDMANFKFSNRPAGIIPSSSTAKTVFTPYQSYVSRVSFNKYQGGSLLEQQKVNDAFHSYLWDYNNQYPVAQVVNAQHANIAYTGFEADAFGNWIVTGGASNSILAFTGNKSYSFSNGNSITKAGLAQGNYVVSYWSMNGALVTTGTTLAGRAKNNWTYYEHKFNNVTSVALTASGNTVLDEVRLYPAGAQMTTYTYKPLVGVSSISDPNNNTIFYKYDVNGRLEVIKDQDGKVTQYFRYHYKGQ